MSKPRYFVLLLGRETVEETIGNVEETHGPVVERHDDEHGGPVQTAKLYPSLCGKLVFGVVEIEPPGVPKPEMGPRVSPDNIPDLWPEGIFDLPGDRDKKP